MLSLRCVTLVGLVGGALVTGCIVSTEEGDPPKGVQYTYPTEGDFCRAMATAECSDALVEACYGVANADNKTSCISVRSQPASCNPTGLTYHPAVADACVAVHGTIYADKAVNQDELDQLDEACVPVFNRGYGAGSTCNLDVDCDTSAELRCVIKPGAASGVCAVPIEVKGGTKCNLAEQVCEDGFYCNETQICQIDGAAGDACSPAAPCGQDSNCVPNTAVPDSYSCVAKFIDGTTCLADTDCQSGFCITGKCRGTYQLTNSERCNDFLP